MTPELLEMWSGRFEIATVVLTLVTALCGVFAWRFATWSGDSKDEELRRFQIEANVAISKSSAVAESAKADAEHARLDLARIDPMNLPIKSMKADVYLLVEGSSFFNSLLNQNPLPPPYASFCLFGEEDVENPKADPLAILSCNTLGWTLASIPKGSEFGNANAIKNARGFAMSFDWPSNDFMNAHFSAHPELRLWIDRNDISTADLDKKPHCAIIKLFGLPAGVMIIGGSCVLMLNGSIPRRFSFPSVTNDGQVLCLPLKTLER